MNHNLDDYKQTDRYPGDIDTCLLRDKAHVGVDKDCHDIYFA